MRWSRTCFNAAYVRALRDPKIVISTVLGVALLATLVGVSDIRKVMGVVARLNPLAAPAFVMLMVVYESIRGVQWHVLVNGLGVRVPLRAEMFSYMWGEATKAAPAGNYFQNYLLGRIEGEDFSRTSAATTLIVVTEIAWGLLIVAMIQINGWPWLRPVILIASTVFAVLVAISAKMMRSYAAAAPSDHAGLAGSLLGAIRRFREGAAALCSPRLLASQAMLCGLYISCAGVGLLVLAIGLGINNVSWWQFIGIYAFTMTVGLLMPLPIDLGVIEVSGVGALLACGVSQEVAVALMLLNRILNLGSAIAIAALSTMFFRDELQRAVRPQGEQGRA